MNIINQPRIHPIMSTSSSTSTTDTSKSSSKSTRLVTNLIRQYSGLKIKDRCCKTNQIHPSDKTHQTISSILSSESDTSPSLSDTLLPFGFPSTHSLHPPIDPFLKPVDLVDSLSQLHKKLLCVNNNHLVYLEQYSILCSLGDPKSLRKCLHSARRDAVEVHDKVILSAWLRYERREDEFVGNSGLYCVGRNLECPKSCLVHGYYDHCRCCEGTRGGSDDVGVSVRRRRGSLCLEEDGDVWFYIGKERVKCARGKIASLSTPLKVMLYGNFMESVENVIDFSHIGISVEGMRGVRLYSEFGSLNSCLPNVVLEILSFANMFCCEEMKSDCDRNLSLMVSNINEALLLIDYGLEERAYLLTASCLQVILRELPGYLYNSKVMNIFCSSDARQRLAMAGHASFLLYYFLSQIAMEDDRKSNLTLVLLERMRDSATERWQKALSLHQLGCVFLERKEYVDAQHHFELASDLGSIYSIAGVARAKYKQGQRFLAYDMINSIIAKHKPTGWMYQERSFYNLGNKKILDLNDATKLDPTLGFPYKYRAVALMEGNEIEAAIKEINRIIGFKISSDCLELRAWLHIVDKDYDAAIRDIRALLTLEPNYLMFNGKVRCDHLVELLNQHVSQWSPADCWLKLYDCWSSVDDIGSLAVIHQMLVNEPGKSILRFRQSLLLLRLNCQKAAMRSLRLARNHSTSNYEKLVYEGWILYDTGHREEALSKAEESLSIQRSFEAFFLKAYVMADEYLNTDSASYVVGLLEEALRCPSDGLRKGQALNNLGSIYVDCGKLDMAADCYVSALKIKHTRAHQGLARVFHLKNEREAAYEEVTKLIEKAQNKASAYEKRSEYCDRDLANNDLSIASQLDPLRTYPYRYRAAVLMDDQKQSEAVEELTNAISFKPDLQMLNLRAAFYESMGDFTSALRDCEAALCLDPTHRDTLDLYNRSRTQDTCLQE